MVDLKNKQLNVKISETGGTLESIAANGMEYLWQRENGKGALAPNLFPLVGRLFKKTYTLHGKHYQIAMHGFLPQAQMQVIKHTETDCTLLLEDSAETHACYPFSFSFEIEYALQKNTVAITFRTTNRGGEVMYCGMGGHPGFNVPLEPRLKFEDYAIEFSAPCSPELVEFSDAVLTTGSVVRCALAGGVRLPLRHDLFCKDALVFANAARGVKILSEKSTHGVEVAYPQMPYVGIWQFDKGAPPFICIEPWSQLPGREGVVEELSTMKDITEIAPGKTHQNRWTITVW